MNLRHLLPILLISVATTACGGGGGGGGDDDAPRAAAPTLDFIHYANVDNIVLSMSRVEHPLLNDNPGAVFLVTQNLNPEGALAQVLNRAPVSVQYIGTPEDGRWWIFNADASAMAPGVSFNVSIMGPVAGETALEHVVTADSRLPSLFAFISNTGASQAPLAFVQPSFGSPAARGVINRRYVGVLRGDSEWAVFNEDIAVLNLGTRFMLGLVPESANTFVHVATAGNSSGSATTIRHPRLDGNADAIIQITHTLSGGGAARYSDKPLAVRYLILSGVWQITNQDGSAMEADTAFNVSIRN